MIVKKLPEFVQDCPPEWAREEEKLEDIEFVHESGNSKIVVCQYNVDYIGGYSEKFAEEFLYEYSLTQSIIDYFFPRFRELIIKELSENRSDWRFCL